PPPRRVSDRMAAEEIFDRDRLSVVVGTPGGGKTSLFRAHLIRAVAARRAGELETPLPILVSAAALSGKPLAAALAEAVTAELGSFGLLEKLPDALFKECPYEDVPWLVMVDGLDEITDTAARRKLLAALEQISDGSRGRQYRFVIATRPLPEWELAVLGAQAPVYELEPFTWADLNRVSADWFRVLGLENPDRVAERFASTVRRTRVFGLARTPLMAALLCQLHGANPDAPLPVSRGEIYRKYVEQLTRRMQSADTSGIQAQVRAGLARYGDEALGEGWRTLERLPELISRSAAELHGGCPASILDIVSGLPGAACPKRVPVTVWREYLQSLLLRSGLVILRGGELSFFHQTVGEFLAAAHATRSVPACLESLAALFGRKHRVSLVERILVPRVSPPPEVDTSSRDSSSTSVMRSRTRSPIACSGWSTAAAWPGADSSPSCSGSAPTFRGASSWRWRGSSWIWCGSWATPCTPHRLGVPGEWCAVIRRGSKTLSWPFGCWAPSVRRTRSTGYARSPATTTSTLPSAPGRPRPSSTSTSM
ncbi:NACHT domain-containing protein, partial [Amycolatopsis sp.]|uniref:NACHT domain-containing protein n=1 Tax=Amycolatopsis sp. TaxID=37632 RepID=UPI002D8014AE